MKIEFVESDLFDYVPAKCGRNEHIYIAHVANCRGGWGSGFVVPLGKKYPLARTRYLELSIRPEFVLGTTQLVAVADKVIVANMVAQTLGGKRPLFYNHLSRCMDQLANDIINGNNGRIVSPFFGSALAGGDFNFIAELIQDCWLSRGIPVTICYRSQDAPENFKIPTG